MGRSGWTEKSLDKEGHEQGNKRFNVQVSLEFDFSIRTELECDTWLRNKDLLLLGIQQKIWSLVGRARYG